MRDREAYLKEGRNDPGDRQQMHEHPYDFVSLPDKPEKGQAVGHHAQPADRWSGVLRLVYRTEGPLHVGSGIFQSPEECGLQERKPVKGIVRSVTGPILPGSSWKGAVRSRFEAITRSRLTLAMKSTREWPEKVPNALYEGPDQQSFKINDPRVRALKASTVNLKKRDEDRKGPKVDPRKREMAKLDPAAALFGCMGYRGRVLPGEGRIQGGKAERALVVAPLDSPRMHRNAKPGRIKPAGHNAFEIQEVEGRKFYYDGDLITRRTVQNRFGGGSRESFEKIDYITEGAEIHIDIRLRSVSLEEIGALLVASGYGEAVGVVRFGGYKGVGLGKVSLISVEPILRQGGPTSRRSVRELDLSEAVDAARGSLLDASALDELHRITTAWRAET